MLRRNLPLIVALLLCLPALFMDHYNDDWIVRATLRGIVPHADRNPLRLYEFMGSADQVGHYIRDGQLPWFSDPHLTIRFFRPLASLGLWFDHRVLGSPVLARLHSIAWFVAFLFAARRLIDRVLAPRAARWAFWTLCLAGYHAGTVFWPSARNGLSAATIALVALNVHVGDRLDDKPVRVVRVLLLLVLSLLFAETALGIIPVILAVEVFAVKKSAREKSRVCGPVMLVGIAYLAMYSLLGYGVRGSGAYIDPAREPMRFLAAMPGRWMTLVSEALVGTPSEFTMLVPPLVNVLTIVGSIALALASYALYRTRAERPHRYVEALAAGSLVALIPTLGGVLGGRLLAIAGLGAALVMGALADAAMKRNKRWMLAPLMIVMVMGVLSRVGQGASQIKATRAERRIGEHPVTACPIDSDRVLIEGADPGLGMSAGAIVLSEWPGFRGTLRTLAMDPVDHIVRRTGAQTIEVQPVRGTIASAPFAQVSRQLSNPFVEGQTIDAGRAQIVTRDVVEGRPRRIEVTFARPLADRSTCLLRWRNGQLEQMDPPAMGTSVTLVHEPGPLGL